MAGGSSEMQISGPTTSAGAEATPGQEQVANQPQRHDQVEKDSIWVDEYAKEGVFLLLCQENRVTKEEDARNSLVKSNSLHSMFGSCSYQNQATTASTSGCSSSSTNGAGSSSSSSSSSNAAAGPPRQGFSSASGSSSSSTSLSSRSSSFCSVKTNLTGSFIHHGRTSTNTSTTSMALSTMNACTASSTSCASGFYNLPHLPTPLWMHIASFLQFTKPIDSMIYVCGGRNVKDGALKSAEMFDIWHGKWTWLPDMHYRRAGCAASRVPAYWSDIMTISSHANRTVNYTSGQLHEENHNSLNPSLRRTRTTSSGDLITTEEILVTGGYDERGIVEGLLSTCESYNPLSNQWTLRANLLRKRWGHGAVTVTNSGTGGGESSSSFYHSTTSNHNYSDVSCTQVCHAQTPRTGQGQSHLSSSTRNFVYVVGGCSLHPNAPEEENFMETLRSCEIYDPIVDKWYPAPQLQTGRAGGRVTCVSGRYIIVVGGCDDVFGRAEMLTTMEILDTEMIFPTMESVNGGGGGGSTGYQQHNNLGAPARAGGFNQHLGGGQHPHNMMNVHTGNPMNNQINYGNQLLDSNVNNQLTWSYLDVSLREPRTTAAVCTVDDRIIVFGGAPSLASVEIVTEVEEKIKEICCCDDDVGSHVFGNSASGSSASSAGLSSAGMAETRMTNEEGNANALVIGGRWNAHDGDRDQEQQHDAQEQREDAEITRNYGRNQRRGGIQHRDKSEDAPSDHMQVDSELDDELENEEMFLPPANLQEKEQKAKQNRAQSRSSSNTTTTTTRFFPPPFPLPQLEENTNTAASSRSTMSRRGSRGVERKQIGIGGKKVPKINSHVIFSTSSDSDVDMVTASSSAASRRAASGKNFDRGAQKSRKARPGGSTRDRHDASSSSSASSASATASMDCSVALEQDHYTDQHLPGTTTRRDETSSSSTFGTSSSSSSAWIAPPGGCSSTTSAAPVDGGPGKKSKNRLLPIPKIISTSGRTRTTSRTNTRASRSFLLQKGTTTNATSSASSSASSLNDSSQEFNSCSSRSPSCSSSSSFSSEPPPSPLRNRDARELLSHDSDNESPLQEVDKRLLERWILSDTGGYTLRDTDDMDEENRQRQPRRGRGNDAPGHQRGDGIRVFLDRLAGTNDGTGSGNRGNGDHSGGSQQEREWTPKKTIPGPSLRQGRMGSQAVMIDLPKSGFDFPVKTNQGRRVVLVVGGEDGEAQQPDPEDDMDHLDLLENYDRDVTRQFRTLEALNLSTFEFLTTGKEGDDEAKLEKLLEEMNLGSAAGGRGKTKASASSSSSSSSKTKSTKTSAQEHEGNNDHRSSQVLGAGGAGIAISESTWVYDNQTDIKFVDHGGARAPGASSEVVLNKARNFSVDEISTTASERDRGGVVPRPQEAETTGGTSRSSSYNAPMSHDKSKSSRSCHQADNQNHAQLPGSGSTSSGSTGVHDHPAAENTNMLRPAVSQQQDQFHPVAEVLEDDHADLADFSVEEQEILLRLTQLESEISTFHHKSQNQLQHGEEQMMQDRSNWSASRHKVALEVEEVDMEVESRSNISVLPGELKSAGEGTKIKTTRQAAPSASSCSTKESASAEQRSLVETTDFVVEQQDVDEQLDEQPTFISTTRDFHQCPQAGKNRDGKNDHDVLSSHDLLVPGPEANLRGALLQGSSSGFSSSSRKSSKSSTEVEELLLVGSSTAKENPDGRISEGKWIVSDSAENPQHAAFFHTVDGDGAGDEDEMHVEIDHEPPIDSNYSSWKSFPSLAAEDEDAYWRDLVDTYEGSDNTDMKMTNNSDHDIMIKNNNYIGSSSLPHQAATSTTSRDFDYRTNKQTTTRGNDFLHGLEQQQAPALDPAPTAASASSWLSWERKDHDSCRSAGSKNKAFCEDNVQLVDTAKEDEQAFQDEMNGRRRKKNKKTNSSSSFSNSSSSSSSSSSNHVKPDRELCSSSEQARKKQQVLDRFLLPVMLQERTAMSVCLGMGMPIASNRLPRGRGREIKSKQQCSSNQRNNANDSLHRAEGAEYQERDLRPGVEAASKAHPAVVEEVNDEVQQPFEDSHKASRERAAASAADKDTDTSGVGGGSRNRADTDELGPAEWFQR
ncbi:unnamed protein product [Amoebophrya sp. A120]|nr:unnamed protein product [Amoebophrya sp. A120]|eukprot:GSA120T00010205001.1